MYSFIRNIIQKESKLDTNGEIPLPKDILQHTLFGYLEPDEALILAKLSTHFAKSCQKQLDVTRLLQHVVRGEQDEAKAMLQKDRSLLLQKGNVNDLSSRKFYQITAFQYALWALDRHMWEMILEYLPENEAAKQLEELETTGVEYAKPAPDDRKAETLIKNEKHFDFSPLIAALQDYINNHVIRNENQQKAAWCKNVGGAQKNVPAHVAAEYCRSDRGFHPTPAFKEATLPRSLDFCKYGGFVTSYWFSDPGLGSNFAVYRGIVGWGALNGRRMAKAVSNGTGLWLVDERLDLQAITALCQVRTNELEILKDRLLTQAVTPASLRR